MAEPTNGFTTKDILIRLEQKVDHALGDHEQRIRKSESAISRMKGAVAVLAFVVPVIAGLIASLVH